MMKIHFSPCLSICVSQQSPYFHHTAGSFGKYDRAVITAFHLLFHGIRSARGMMCGALADIRPRPRKPPSPPFPLFLSLLTISPNLNFLFTVVSDPPPPTSFIALICWRGRPQKIYDICRNFAKGGIDRFMPDFS